MQIIIDSLLTNYNITGNGKKTILFIHGWADSSATFARLQASLKEEYITIALDLPGFGGSQSPSQPWGLNDYAEFIQHFLNKIQQAPYAIIGHSNGGAIALKGLAEKKLEATKLVLIASAGVRDTKGQNMHRKLWSVIAKVGKVATFAIPVRIRARLRKRLYAAAGSDMLVSQNMQETFKRIVSEDIQVLVTRITVPTLLIYGDQDEATPLNYARAFAQKLPNATLVVIQGAGHFVHQAPNGEVAKKIQDFLQ